MCGPGPHQEELSEQIITRASDVPQAIPRGRNRLGGWLDFVVVVFFLLDQSSW